MNDPRRQCSNCARVLVEDDPAPSRMRLVYRLKVIPHEALFFLVEPVNPDLDDEHHRYWYEESTCAVNFLGSVLEVERAGTEDPHGIVEFKGREVQYRCPNCPEFD